VVFLLGLPMEYEQFKEGCSLMNHRLLNIVLFYLVFGFVEHVHANNATSTPTQKSVSQSSTNINKTQANIARNTKFINSKLKPLTKTKLAAAQQKSISVETAQSSPTSKAKANTEDRSKQIAAPVNTVQTTKSTIAQPPIETVKVKLTAAAKTLTFQSTMRPVIESIVNSPAAGKVFKASKEYGDAVNKGDVIIDISSSEARKELMSNVSSLLSTQTSYATSMSNLKKNVELEKKGIISEQELSASQNEFVQSLIEMTRVKLQFEKTAKLLGFDKRKIQAINIGKDIDMILKNKDSTEDLMAKILSNEYTVSLMAKSSGTFLPPINVGGDSKTIYLKPGAEIENRQNIGIIASPNAVEMQINVPEFDVVKMQLGQEVSVVVPALQNKKLKGEIVQIRRFEYQPRQGQIPTIPVVAKAYCSDCHELYSISCNTTIIEPEEQTLQIPITAIKKENNIYYVQKMVNNKPVKTKVETGSTTKTSITIKSGLQKGDEVVKNYPSN
jgi:multidrug efflux pump subunit AcrA (membrane-fusion protein)